MSNLTVKYIALKVRHVSECNVLITSVKAHHLTVINKNKKKTVIIVKYEKTGALMMWKCTVLADGQWKRKMKVLHLHNALGEVAWYFCEAFVTTVHYVVVTAAAGWTHSHLWDTRPRLCLGRTCRR